MSAMPGHLRHRTSAAFFLAALSVIASRAAGTEIPATDRRSDYEFMSSETRAIQDDDNANPGMFSVLDGEGLWNKKDGALNVSCADCHTIASMRGNAARYPGYDLDYKRPVDLQERINICRARRQDASPLPLESRELLALAAFVAHQSRGSSIQVTIDERLKPFFDAGRELFEGRQGQLNMSCAQCHDDNWGKRLAGNVIPQAQPTGYPVYRSCEFSDSLTSTSTASALSLSSSRMSRKNFGSIASSNDASTSGDQPAAIIAARRPSLGDRRP
jgi:L-cysteine S-thiosulfotransferase